MNHTKSQVEAAHKRAAVFGGKMEDHLPSEASGDLSCIVRNVPLKGLPATNPLTGEPLGQPTQDQRLPPIVAQRPWEQEIMDESGCVVGVVPSSVPHVTTGPKVIEVQEVPFPAGVKQAIADNLLDRVNELAANTRGKFVTLDSGKRAEFNTGAVRDTNEGKGRFDLISPIALKRLAQLYERGAAKYGPRNWEKGIPLWRYLDSAERHLNDYKAGDRAEDHLIAVAWNIFGYIHTEQLIQDKKLPPSLAEERPNGA